MSENEENIAVNSTIITVKDLLQNEKLQIPEYQRPYKWTTKNVNQLIDDIIFHKDLKLDNEKIPYRLGTLVLHHEAKTSIHNIVDGQQRTLTLTLIAYALELDSRNLNPVDISSVSAQFSA